jgi:hypothetical protein
LSNIKGVISTRYKNKNANVAQLVESCICNAIVVSSSLTVGFNLGVNMMQQDIDIKFEEWLNNFHLFFKEQIESVSLLSQKDYSYVISKVKLCDLRRERV